MKKKYTLPLFLVLVINGAAGQVLSLDSIFKVIDNNQPQLRMYESQIKAYDAYASGAKSLDPPQVGAGLWMTPYNTMMWKPDPIEGTQGMGSFMVSVQQMFMNPKKLNANSSYMKSMSSVDKEMKNAMVNEIHSMAKMNYYEWIILRKKLKVLSENEALLNYVVKSAEIKYAYGMDKLNGYYKAKAMLGDIQNMKIMTSQMISQIRTNLNTLMNRDKNFQFDIDSIYVIKNYEDAATDTSAITNNRSDYKSFAQNINVLKSKQLYERSKRLPDFGIKYDHMVAFGRQPQQFSLMAMVSIPIVPWSSKMYRASVTGLNHEIEAVQNQQQNLVNEASGKIQVIKDQIRNKKQQISLYEKTILSSIKKNYQATLLAYEQNTEELFMVLDAWANLKVAQTGYLDLLKELLLLQVEYERQLQIQ